MTCQNVAHPYIEAYGGDAGHLKYQAMFNPQEGGDEEEEFIDLDDDRVRGLVVTIEKYNCFEFENDGLNEAFDTLFGTVDSPVPYVIPNRCGDKDPEKEWSTSGWADGRVPQCDNQSIAIRPCVKDSFTSWPAVGHILLGVDPPDPSLWPSVQYYMGHGRGKIVPQVTQFNDGGTDFWEYNCFEAHDQQGGLSGNFPTVVNGISNVVLDRLRSIRQLYDFNLVWYRNAGTPPPSVDTDFGSFTYGTPWPDRSIGFRATFQNRYPSDDYYRFNFRVGMATVNGAQTQRVRIPAPWSVPLILPVTGGFGAFGIGADDDERLEAGFAQFDWDDVKIVIVIRELILDNPVWGNCCSPFREPNGGSFDNDYPPGACYHTDPSFCSQGDYGLPGERVFGLWAGGSGAGGGLCEQFFRCNVKGACCYNNWPSAPLCENDVSSSDCQMTKDRLFAGPGTVCGPGTCPPEGACCLLTGDCVMQFEEQCQTPPFGFWWGALFKEGLFCEHLMGPDDFPGDTIPNPTTCPVRGKCCCRHPSGNVTCNEREAGECLFQNQCLYGGDGTACQLPWDPDPCVGACCVPYAGFSDNCEEHDWFRCRFELGGDFFGLGTTCASEYGNPAVLCDVALGACCINSACYFLSAENCAASGGIFNEGVCCPDAFMDACIPWDFFEHCDVDGCGCCHVSGVSGGSFFEYCCNNVSKSQCEALPSQQFPTLGGSWTFGSCNMNDDCPVPNLNEPCDDVFPVPCIP